MKKLFLLLAFHISLLTFHVFAQQPTLEWVRKFPDTTNNFSALSKALAVDSVGNVYIAGEAETAYWSAYCTVKYAPSGVKLWSAIYYGTNTGGRFAKAIAVDRTGNVYVTGYSFETGRYFDYCTIKYNSSGVQQWVNLYDGPSHGIDQGVAISVDDAGNIYVTGFSALQGESSFQVTTIKYAPDGRELWVRRYGSPAASTEPKSLVINDSCNVFITGSNFRDALTMKYDSSGNLLWVQEYQGRGFYDISNILTRLTCMQLTILQVQKSELLRIIK